MSGDFDNHDQWSPDDADWTQSRGRDDSSVMGGPDVIAALSGHPGSGAGAQELAEIAERAPTRKELRRERQADAKEYKRAEKADRRRRPLWRGRILPKSILGISLLMLAAGVGAAISGTALYMNYQYRRDQSDALMRSFNEIATVEKESVKAEGVNARRRIQDEIEPIRKIAATGDTLRDLLTKTAPSLFEVSTFDVNGAPSVGTAFVVASDSTRSFLVTSYDVIRAATAVPGPAITVRQGTKVIDAQLWSWQPDRDLAVLVSAVANLPRIEWSLSSDVRLGQQIFAFSATGTAGGSVTQGFMADVSATAVQHTAALGTHFRGGPLLADRGTVVGVASRVYQPLGFASDGVWFGAPIRLTCEKLLKCPTGEVTGGGQVTGIGAQDAPTAAEPSSSVPTPTRSVTANAPASGVAASPTTTAKP